MKIVTTLSRISVHERSCNLERILELACGPVKVALGQRGFNW